MKPSRLSRVTYNYKAEGCDGPDSQGPFIQSNPKLSPNHAFFFLFLTSWFHANTHDSSSSVRRYIEKMPKFQTVNIRVKVLLLKKKKGIST